MSGFLFKWMYLFRKTLGLNSAGWRPISSAVTFGLFCATKDADLWFIWESPRKSNSSILQYYCVPWSPLLVCEATLHHLDVDLDFLFIKQQFGTFCLCISVAWQRCVVKNGKIGHFSLDSGLILHRKPKSCSNKKNSCYREETLRKRHFYLKLMCSWLHGKNICFHSTSILKQGAK